MKRCLVDVNVWLALMVAHHDHHGLALKWFQRLDEEEAGICRIVQLSVARLLATKAVMGDDAVPLSVAWTATLELIDDQRVEFVPEPPGMDAAILSLFKYPVPTGKLLADAYLAAFAINSSKQLITLDRGFRQFNGLNVKILNQDD